MDIKLKEKFCFLTQEEVNSWNRVHRAPGSRMADHKDEAKVNRIKDLCEALDIMKIRSKDGVKLWGSEA